MIQPWQRSRRHWQHQSTCSSPRHSERRSPTSEAALASLENTHDSSFGRCSLLLQMPLITALFVPVSSFSSVKSVIKDLKQWTQAYKNYYKNYLKQKLKAPQEQETCPKTTKQLKTFRPLFLWYEAQVAAADRGVHADIARLESLYVWAE